MKMPFGKFKGQEISTLDWKYCYGLLKNIQFKSYALEIAIINQYEANKPASPRRMSGAYHDNPGYDYFDDDNYDYEGIPNHD